MVEAFVFGALPTPLVRMALPLALAEIGVVPKAAPGLLGGARLALGMSQAAIAGQPLREAKDLGLHQLYRALDLLAEHGEAIEEEVFWNSADLFKLDVDLVFYDATTAWFETDDEDVARHEWRELTFEPLRKRGHSKEGRDNDPQVIIALAVTREGLPVRSWVFPGNTPDVTTIAKIKDNLCGMKLGRTLFVGDAGRQSRARKTASKTNDRELSAPSAQSSSHVAPGDTAS